jgi:hypothetical protein
MSSFEPLEAMAPSKASSCRCTSIPGCHCHVSQKNNCQSHIRALGNQRNLEPCDPSLITTSFTSAQPVNPTRIDTTAAALCYCMTCTHCNRQLVMCSPNYLLLYP